MKKFWKIFWWIFWCGVISFPLMYLVNADSWGDDLLRFIGFLDPKVPITQDNFWQSWFIVFLITCVLSLFLIPFFKKNPAYDRKLAEISSKLQDEIRNHTFHLASAEEEKTMDPLEVRQRKAVYDILKRKGQI